MWVMVKTASITYDTLLETMLFRIRRSMNRGEGESYLLDMPIRLWCAVTEEDYTPDRSHILELDANGTFLHIINLIHRSWENGTDTRFSEQAALVNSCFSALYINLKSSVGKDFLIALKAAFSHGLLELCLSLSRYAPLNCEGDVNCDFPIVFLRRHLPSVLARPSVVYATMKAIGALSNSTLELLSTGHPVYREAWCDLQALLSRHLASTIYFRFNKPQYCCSNVRLMVLDKTFCSL